MLPSLNKLRRFFCNEAGSASAEACLWLPIMLGLFITTFDATYVFLRDGEIRRVVQEGGRQYIKGLHGTDLASAEDWIETSFDPFLSGWIPVSPAVSVPAAARLRGWMTSIHANSFV